MWDRTGVKTKAYSTRVILREGQEEMVFFGGVFLFWNRRNTSKGVKRVRH